MKIVVAGGGIAGCVSAIGMKRLGYDVVLINKPRPFDAYEGFSTRTVEALERVGCPNALKSVGVLSLRSSVWNALSRNANSEYLTFRPDFDKALLIDAANEGVDIMEGSVIGSIVNNAPGVMASVKTHGDEEMLICADAAIDARGRFTPYSAHYSTGPKSYSLLHKLSIPIDTPPHTTLHSVPEGWIWQASLGNGIGYVQMTCTDETAKMIRSYDELSGLLHRQNADTWILEDAYPDGGLIRRDAYGKLHNTIVTGRVFQAGDAASSVDPLSGNGVFQSLSMATILPYVIHTVLTKNETDEGVAATFYKERVRDLFTRYSKTGRDFYKSEERFHGTFWDERRLWPHEETSAALYKIEEKAVLQAPFIERRHVLVTQRHPMGVSYFEGIDIIPLVERLHTFSFEERTDILKEFAHGIDSATLFKLTLWLGENGILPLSQSS